MRTERATVTALDRELRSRSLHREVNERLVELIKQFALDGALDSPMQAFCEGGLERCLTPIEMTLSEYEAVRAGPGRWVVSSAHINELADSVIARRNGYALIHHAPARPSNEASTSGKEATSPPTADLSQR
jgi:hypothetical protein